MHDDLIDAVNWAVKKGITEPGRVAIAGTSYGGYATLAEPTFTPKVFACGVDQVDPSSHVTIIEKILPFWRPIANMFYQHIGDPADPIDRKRMRTQSPLSRVDAIVAPLLIGRRC